MRKQHDRHGRVLEALLLEEDATLGGLGWDIGPRDVIHAQESANLPPPRRIAGVDDLDPAGRQALRSRPFVQELGHHPMELLVGGMGGLVHQVIDETLPHRPEDVLVRSPIANGNEQNTACGRMCATNLAEQLGAGHPGEMFLGEHQGDLAALDGRTFQEGQGSIRSRLALDDVVGFVPTIQLIGGLPESVGVVVHDQEEGAIIERHAQSLVSVSGLSNAVRPPSSAGTHGNMGRASAFSTYGGGIR